VASGRSSFRFRNYGWTLAPCAFRIWHDGLFGTMSGIGWVKDSAHGGFSTPVEREIGMARKKEEVMGRLGN
jgi:hypothetical protein